MNETPNALHILTPLSDRTPRRLVEVGLVKRGDLIADFRGFPPSVWQAAPESALEEITARLVESRDYWTPVREWLVEFTAQTGLQDTLQIDGYGVWWTLNAQRFVPGLTEMGNIFVWIDLLRGVTGELPSSEVVIYGRHEPIMLLAEQILPTEATRVVQETNRKPGARNRPPRKPLLLLTRVMLGIVYLVHSLFRPPDVCVFSNTNLVRRSVDGSGQELRDVYLGNVVRALQQKGHRVTVVEKYGWNASWASLAARGFFFPSDVIYAMTSRLARRFARLSNGDRAWRRAWAKIRPTVQSHLHYRECDIAAWAMPKIAEQFNRRVPEFAHQTRLWQRLLDLWNPRVIYVNNAYGPAALAPVIAAKTLNIPSIELQHGVIGRNHFAYLVPNKLRSAPRFPLCDRMVVWGKHTKKFLIDHHVYDAQKLMVAGFPRIDRLDENLPTRADALEGLGVPPDASVVLYTPNKFAEAFRSPLLDSLARLPSSSTAYWIIKPHPAMKTYSNWREAICKRRLRNVTVVSGDADFYALLAACDVHVTFASTTLIEAAILGKPNVGLRTPSTVDPAGYAEAGAFLSVHPGAVGPVVDQLLSDAEWQEQLMATQRDFAAEWCLHDGNAVGRIADLIESVGTSSLGGSV